MRKIKKLQVRGFSLVELSISLAIIGMIASSALSVAVTNDYYTKELETNRKMDKIEEALAGFVAFNKRLPCVADGTIAPTATTFGQEGTQTPAAGAVACPNKNFNSSYVNAGVVPVDKLGLPDDFMFDGWGRRITYVVDYRMANNSTTNTGCVTGNSDCFNAIANTNNTLLKVNDASGTQILPNASYVLISHGENGHGAFAKNGGATRINGFPGGNPYRDATASAHELENAELDNAGANTAYDDTFITRAYIRVDDKSAAASARTYFDDIVRYKTKNQILLVAGALTYNSICYYADQVVNNPGSSYCTGAAAEDVCEQYAVEIYKRCLQ